MYLYNNIMQISNIGDFLYYVDLQYKDIDYDYAIKYFYDISFYKGDKNNLNKNSNVDGKHIKDMKNGGCTSSIGVGGDIAKIANMADGYSKEKFDKLLPFFLLDGINEKGLTISVNYNPNDFGMTYGINGDKSGVWISLQMFVRYVMDNFATVEELIKWLKTDGKVYGRFNEDGTNQEYHFLVADDNNTYVIEFVDNEVKIIDVKDKPYITNFHIYNTQFEKDGKIDYKNVSNYANGIERYNIVVENYNSTSIKQGMRNVLTKCYCSNMSKEETKPIWYSEFMYIDYSLDINTLLTNKEKYKPVIEQAYKEFKVRDRNKHNTFHTLYSCVYNLDNKTLNLVTQEENDNKMEFFI